MDVTPSTGRLLRFGLFQLDPKSGELLRSGRRVRLQDQPFRVLALLLERAGQVVTREELQQKLWPTDTFVAFEDSLNTAVKRLRYALGDSADNPTFIETVPRRGYRFIAPVSEVAVTAPAATASAPPPVISRRARAATWIGAAVVAIVVVSTLALAAFSRSSSSSETSSAPVRLVVLPLKNLSNDPEQQYFADGMTEELITRLASLGGLRVISRTSAMKFKETNKLLPQIAKELKVDAVVEGSVLHSGNRVRITAQLIHAATDQHLWAESYETDERDVLQLQNEVAHEIAEKVTSKLRRSRAATVERERRINPEAHRAYLRGRYRWHTRRKDELLKAIEDFKRAIAIDPNYAPAYAGLVDVYLVLPLLQISPQEEVYPKAKEAAEKALELDPMLPEAHNSAAYVKMYLDWDFSGAERAFRRAIELNPNYATAHQWYAELLSLQRRHQEAFAHMRIALELDPLSAVMHHQMGQSYQQARRYDEAIQEYKNAIALDPAFVSYSGGAMAWAYSRQGRPERVVETLKLLGVAPADISKFAEAAARRGDRALRRKILESSTGGSAHPYWTAHEHVAAGLDEKALAWLERALDSRDDAIFWVNVDPEWDHLRNDPRFVAIQQKIGLSRPRTVTASLGN